MDKYSKDQQLTAGNLVSNFKFKELNWTKLMFLLHTVSPLQTGIKECRKTLSSYFTNRGDYQVLQNYLGYTRTKQLHKNKEREGHRKGMEWQ